MAKDKLNNMKDLMYQFLSEPTREKFSDLIINGTGEQSVLDYKREWIKEQKIAQIILGIANTEFGGVIIFGIDEKDDGTVDPCGLNELEDKADINKKISKYLPESLVIEILDFDYSGEDYAKLKDRKFQVIYIKPEDRYLPYVCTKTSEELKEGCIYTRRGTNTVQANSIEVEKLLNRRIATIDLFGN